MQVYFATSNKNKYREAKEIIGNVKRFEFNHIEIRSDSLEEIAIEAVKVAYTKIKKPVFVEDTGLFIKSLNGFPGTYSGWVFKKIGNEGILKLLKGIKKRGAEFRTCIAFNDGTRIKTFFGVCKGKIAVNERGKQGFGYDSIFIPEGYKYTFGESKSLKNKLSHRYNSLLKLSRYFKKNKF